MKQLVLHVQNFVSYGDATLPFPLLGNEQAVNTVQCRTPMPWDVTVRNLVIYSGDTKPGRGTVTQQLQKNGLSTALQAALAPSATVPVIDAVHEVTFAQFDDGRFFFSDTGGPATIPGYSFSWCVELESQGNVFGIHALFGSAAAGVGGIGGALGNGFWQSYDHATWPGASYSTSYSISATPGSVTRLVMKSEATPPPVGSSWVAYLRLNKVIQDGTGGTVNTKCEITAGNLTAAATFDLPIVEGDHVEVLYYRTGATHAFELNGQVAVGIGFVPTKPGYYMLTGGSNQVLNAPGYVWPLSSANENNELKAQVPVGPGGFTARGLYIEAPQPGPDPDDEVTRWLRKSGVSTPISVVLLNTQVSGVTLGTVLFNQGDFASILQESTGGSSPDSSRLYWGLELSPLPDLSAGVPGPLRWVHEARVIP